VPLQFGIKWPALDDSHAGPFFEEALYDTPADALATPGNQGFFAQKLHGRGQSVSGPVQKKQLSVSQSSAAEEDDHVAAGP
jgi:hypothetical protein